MKIGSFLSGCFSSSCCQKTNSKQKEESYLFGPPSTTDKTNRSYQASYTPPPKSSSSRSQNKNEQKGDYLEVALSSDPHRKVTSPFSSNPTSPESSHATYIPPHVNYSLESSKSSFLDPDSPSAILSEAASDLGTSPQGDPEFSKTKRPDQIQTLVQQALRSGALSKAPQEEEEKTIETLETVPVNSDSEEEGPTRQRAVSKASSNLSLNSLFKRGRQIFAKKEEPNPQKPSFRGVRQTTETDDFSITKSDSGSDEDLPESPKSPVPLKTLPGEEERAHQVFNALLQESPASSTQFPIPESKGKPPSPAQPPSNPDDFETTNYEPSLLSVTDISAFDPPTEEQNSLVRRASDAFKKWRIKDRSPSPPLEIGAGGLDLTPRTKKKG